VLSIATGEIGISYNDFWDMRPADFFAAVHGYKKRMADIMQLHQRMHFDSSRLIAQTIAQIHAKKDVVIKPTDIAEFPWDNVPSKKGEDEYASQEDIDAVMIPFFIAGGGALEQT
jgi:hypothetical protein